MKEYWGWMQYSQGFDTMVTFENLLPGEEYEVRVRALTVTGPTPYSNVITIKTTEQEPGISPEPSTQSPVTHSTNSSFIVHWEPPQDCFKLNGYLYGYHYILNSNDAALVIEGYTHNTFALFTDLNPRITYIVKVFLFTSGGSSSNPLIITAKTMPTVPGPVEKLMVYKRDHTMLGLKWAAPKSLKDEIETFEISYYNKSNPTEIVNFILKPKYCIIWPNFYCHILQPLQPNTEYTIKFSELRPASTYSVSVTAKTISLGPATTITAYTRPPIPYMDDLMIVSTNQGVISQYPTITIYQSDNYQQLISAHLIIVLPSSYEGEALNGKLWDNWLNGEVHELVKENFYIAAESQPDDLEKSSIFQLGAGTEAKQGKWGIVIEDKILQQNQEYRFGLVVIMEYQGLFSVGYTETETLIVRN
ncbi:hypothetical protein C0J52_10387 [Blattella germanica]|nr:hypothetical protein C0J52_10387 [Blattella germanica]